VLRKFLNYYAPPSPPESQGSVYRPSRGQDDQRSHGPRHTNSYDGVGDPVASEDSSDRLRTPSEPGNPPTSRRQGSHRLRPLPEDEESGLFEATDPEKEASRRGWKKEVSANLPDGMELRFDRDYVHKLPNDASERVSRPRRQPEYHP